LTAVLVNNLPAASLLAAHRVADPYALLVGLNLGPNLAVTGALSAVLWMAAARQAGVEPSARRFSTIGVVVAPISMALALAALALA
jgi:arsenical pump membrane protein